MAVAIAAADAKGKGKTKDAAPGTPKGKGKDKSKKGKDKSKGSGSEGCGLSDAEKAQKDCYEWLNGDSPECNKNNCPYRHDKSKKGSKPPAAPAAGNNKERQIRLESERSKSQ